MLTENEIKEQCLNNIKVLEQQYFDYIDDGKGTKVRICKEGKTEEEFNALQAAIYRDLEAELIAKGYIDPPEPEPPQPPTPEERLTAVEEALLLLLMEV